MSLARGTSNTNVRGSSAARRVRREYLVREFRADVDVDLTTGRPVPRGEGEPACRCYRCGALLTVMNVSSDRWPVPGMRGGRYIRENLRPSCLACASATGNELRWAATRAERAEATG
jgi:hypothetical protein